MTTQLPPELTQYQPSPQFQEVLNKLNAGFQEAGQLVAKPMNAQTAMKDVTLPLLNLMAEYIKHGQLDTFRYFYSFCMFLHQQQASAADDNLILAIDPELSDEIDGVVSAARANIGIAKMFIGRVQTYLADNKPAGFEAADGYANAAELKAAKAKSEANLELWQALREEALRVMSALNESDEDLGIMAENVENATYDPEDEGEDEVALPTAPAAPAEDDEPYESVIG